MHNVSPDYYNYYNYYYYNYNNKYSTTTTPNTHTMSTYDGMYHARFALPTLAVSPSRRLPC